MSRCIECGSSSGHHATGCPEDVAADDAALVCRCCGVEDDACVVERAGPICADCAPLPPAEIHPGRVARFKAGDVVDIVRGGLSLMACTILSVSSDPLHDVTGRITNAGKSAKYQVTGYGFVAYDWMLELSTATATSTG
jgi:hypothetical protein